MKEGQISQLDKTSHGTFNIILQRKKISEIIDLGLQHMLVLI